MRHSCPTLDASYLEAAGRMRQRGELATQFHNAVAHIGTSLASCYRKFASSLAFNLQFSMSGNIIAFHHETDYDNPSKKTEAKNKHHMTHLVCC